MAAKPMTKTQIIAYFADKFDIPKKQAKEFLEEYANLVVAQVKKAGAFTIPGVGKKVSRLFMGAAMQASEAGAMVMFDHFFEQGGNAFDTAHIYAGGRCERLLGQWVNNRGIRREVVILGKGGAPSGVIHIHDCLKAVG